ncbi:DUF3501 family protein [Inmirania thermothiophila]|uniref:Uncharacterized protein DUF3501 n=1 Tax=Inmirania thermothiophila TaxID=1750597 RepID=A0A3N1XSW4_9GAMM|nr:DUF3501 family protein [Inmirania thermothiophila]ROR29729.1 uncharacterized protein DUF3501 [Inmirania thermothiophila]
MEKLTRDDLLPLERYAEARPRLRAEVMAHKRRRRVPVGPHVTLHFEDRLTMRYQVQEMLRAERIFEPAEIEAELAVYNPLIPDGHNWKATLMIEFDDPAVRRRELARLVGIEDRVWVRVAGFPPVYAVADEDLQRDTGEKTSAVHFLRFELTPEMVRAVRAGADVALGIDHPAYRHAVESLPEPVRASLAEDLDPPA